MSENKETQSLSQYILLGFITVLLVTVLAAVGIPYFFGKPLAGAGEFGDMFGGVNAIFSGLAFIGVIWAILLQKEELGLQRQELKDTRQELAGQREQLELQNSTFKQQAFDSVFFEMLSLHHKIINDMDFLEVAGECLGRPTESTAGRYIRTQRQNQFEDERKTVLHKGRDCMTHYYKVLKSDSAKVYTNEKELLPIERVNTIYRRLYGQVESDLGHYFRNLYTIIKFIDKNAIKNKGQYTNIVRAQLSSRNLDCYSITVYQITAVKSSSRL